ncbi:T9SS type A sorting domain-containing protein [uncultured Sunxiuqinia sp.]|uniref:T9SS type A sorting domain-containing protein n=1 Tax=uncultured Sunxiuqinia sp. TaxID=1573825 RepID=UPI002AA938C6|nr:T9SS type A sorting domain-containing protein [uncultured Sunxiuqinia sp.]
MKKRIFSIILSLFLILPIAFGAKATEPEVDKEAFKIEKIYPNPVKDFVYVELSSKEYSIVQFDLIDILGNKVKLWKKVELVPGNQHIRLETNDLNNGFYLLRATINKQIIVKRIRKL